MPQAQGISQPELRKGRPHSFKALNTRSVRGVSGTPSGFMGEAVLLSTAIRIQVL